MPTIRGKSKVEKTRPVYLLVGDPKHPIRKLTNKAQMEEKPLPLPQEEISEENAKMLFSKAKRLWVTERLIYECVDRYRPLAMNPTDRECVIFVSHASAGQRTCVNLLVATYPSAFAIEAKQYEGSSFSGSTGSYYRITPSMASRIADADSGWEKSHFRTLSPPKAIKVLGERGNKDDSDLILALAEAQKRMDRDAATDALIHQMAAPLLKDFAKKVTSAQSALSNMGAAIGAAFSESGQKLTPYDIAQITPASLNNAAGILKGNAQSDKEKLAWIGTETGRIAVDSLNTLSGDANVNIAPINTTSCVTRQLTDEDIKLLDELKKERSGK